MPATKTKPTNNPIAPEMDFINRLYNAILTDNWNGWDISIDGDSNENHITIVDHINGIQTIVLSSSVLVDPTEK